MLSSLGWRTPRQIEKRRLKTGELDLMIVYIVTETNIRPTFDSATSADVTRPSGTTDSSMWCHLRKAGGGRRQAAMVARASGIFSAKCSEVMISGTGTRVNSTCRTTVAAQAGERRRGAAAARRRARLVEQGERDG